MTSGTIHNNLVGLRYDFVSSVSHREGGRRMVRVVLIFIHRLSVRSFLTHNCHRHEEDDWEVS